MSHLPPSPHDDDPDLDQCGGFMGLACLLGMVAFFVITAAAFVKALTL